MGWRPQILEQWLCVMRQRDRLKKMDHSRVNFRIFRWTKENADCKNWWFRLGKLMHSLGLNIDECHKTVFEETMFANLVDNWKSDINRVNAKRGNGRNKLRMYRLLKQDFGTEKYLSILNRSYRSAMSKFRSGTAPIRIETGRYEGVPADERFCPFCPDLVESETHVILSCNIYEDL